MEAQQHVAAAEHSEKVDAEIEALDELAEQDGLSPRHTAYLLRRHGTLDLNPIPSDDPLQPLNWPTWRKNLYLTIYAFHGFMATLISSGLLPLLPILAKVYDKPVSTTTYITSSMIAMYGVAPWFWLPVMNTIGRRPALLISVLATTCANVGSIYCKTFGQQMAVCCVAAFFAAPPTALGSVVVTELYFQHQRGAKTGVWKAAWNIGAPGGPFLMGFVAERAGYKWVFGVFAITNFVLFLAYFFCAPETLWTPPPQGSITTTAEAQDLGWRQTMRFRPIRHGAWSLENAVRPFKTFLNLRIMMPVIAYVMAFSYAAVGLIITVPLAGEKFGLSPQGIGLQFLGFIVGYALGELLIGRGSDLWMKHCTARRGGVRVIEDRLWLAYVGTGFIVVGLIVWGVTLENAPDHWIISPNIGMALDAFGVQVVTTVLITYALDVNPAGAGETGLTLNLLRQEYAFTGPFYYPYMFKVLGFAGTAGVFSGIMVLVSGTLIALTQFTNIGKRSASRL